MLPMPVTALYAGVFALFALFLSFKAGSLRGKTGISILYGEPINWELAENVRRHQNFLEYVPMIIILMGAIELNGGSTLLLHIVGILLIISRIAHMLGLHADNMSHAGRVVGAGGSALLTLVAGGYAVWIGVGALMG